MKTVQAIDSVDSLIPNGNFVQGTAYWTPHPDTPLIWMKHTKFFTTTPHETDPSLLPGEPKYGISARVLDQQTSYPIYCWLIRNDLFAHPIRRIVPNINGHPIGPLSLDIPSPLLTVESTDWGTMYDAVLSSASKELRIVISDSVILPLSTKFQWIRPDQTLMPILIVKELPKEVGTDYRSFEVMRVDGQAITPTDTGEDNTGFGTSKIYFVVRRQPEQGSTVILQAESDEDSGYYLVDRYEGGTLRLTPSGRTLRLIAQNGDVEGLIYTRSSTTATFRSYGKLSDHGVSVGQYLVASAPFHAYGEITAIQTLPDGTEQLVVDTNNSTMPFPITGSGVFKAVTMWAVSPRVRGQCELALPGVRYDLTLVFTTKMPSPIPTPYYWSIKLEFVTEKGSLDGQSKVIDWMAFNLVTSFPVSTGSNFHRFIYKMSVDRAVPIPGLPRLSFTNSTGDVFLAHVAMFKGDVTGTVYGDVDVLDYSASPDGGVIPKGVVIPFIGGSRCPPGWKEVVGTPADVYVRDSDGRPQPSAVVDFEFPKNWRTPTYWESALYNRGTDITTLKFKNIDLSVDGQTSHPWASFKVRLPVKMRPPPYPPVYEFYVKIDGRKVRWFRARMPPPHHRPQRYEEVEVGILKSRIVPGSFLQVIPNAREDLQGNPVFFPYRKPVSTGQVYNMIISGVRTSGKYDLFEQGWENQSYPSGYNKLYSTFNFNSLIPTPDGVMTLIRLISDLMKNINRALLYDPRRTGEPLPSIDVDVDTSVTITEIDVLGDWTQVLDTVGAIKPPAARIIRAGYLKASSNDAGQVEPGSEEHNHRVGRADVQVISPATVNINVTNQGPLSDTDKVPVAANHTHGYLGAGGYSRPEGRGVLLCVKL